MYTLGQSYFAKGLDFNCRPVIVQVKLMAMRPIDANGFNCVIRSEGINILASTDALYTRAEDIRC